ncbi:MAG: glutamine-hydrolyzing carbamoyl-phosphate synthase small subunit [Gemmatimonadales bacterium]|nr:MAG: glutamine-hydrolyzing carbamoyl-phosphate synthase small subunit [Gemmatimonadales bacterium]
MSRPVARLALEDGAVFTGVGFGACEEPRTSAGEVVFCTAMTGYQEALSDPSYAGQILTMTCPQVGNYGVGDADEESSRPQVAGFVVRELARSHSNHRASGDLSGWLRRAGVPGLERIDTRALVRRVRIEGAMRGVLGCDPAMSDDDLVDRAREALSMAGRNLAREVSPPGPGRWTEGLGDWSPGAIDAPAADLRVLALDCGAKRNIYRHLRSRVGAVEIVPWNAAADSIREARPDGLLVSNGPGDPAAVDAAIRTLREVAGEIPTFGICLGHQLLALALGARTFKLKFGHRGANQPVRNLLTGAVEITSQNHGFCVDPDSLAGLDCEMTHVNLNDGTLAGFRHRTRPIFSVQHHPEASPGPHDSVYLFDCFVEMMRTGQPVTAESMRRAQVAWRRPDLALGTAGPGGVR